MESTEFIFIIILLLAVICALVHWHFRTLEKYIKPDVFLKNAINEALDLAIKHNNTVEIKEYTKLLEKIKGKL